MKYQLQIVITRFMNMATVVYFKMALKEIIGDERQSTTVALGAWLSNMAHNMVYIE